MQDLKWEIKFFKRERERRDREVACREPVRPKGELGFVLLSRMPQCGRRTLRGHEVPTTFPTRGADVGGRGVVESTSLRRDREAGLWLSIRGGRLKRSTEFSVPPHPPIPSPNDSQKSLQILLGAHCHGVAHVLVISLLVDHRESLFIGITFFSLFSPPSVLRAAATVFFPKKI